MPNQQRSLRERDRIDNREPQKFNVIIFNDDFTTMELVVKILTDVFFKPRPEAVALMRKVHNSEKAIVGTYTYDIAISKVAKATAIARERKFPLRLEIQPAE